MEEVVIEKQESKKKKIIIISGVLLLLIAAGIIGWFKYQDIQEEKYAKLQAETIVDMKISFLTATIIVGMYSDLWDTAIDNGNDFNDVISDFHDEIEDDSLKTLKADQDSINKNMKLLQNPPENYQESYYVLKDMYGTYTRMAEQADSPSGSLIEFNKKTNDMYSEFDEQSEKLDITLPADVRKLKKEIEKDKKKKEEETQ